MTTQTDVRPVKPVPEGYHTITPYIVADNAAGVIDFLKKAFDAKLVAIHKTPNGQVMNAEIRVGDSMVMIADGRGETPATPTMLYLYMPDVDAAFARAVKAGGEVVCPLDDMFYGDRSGGVKDCCGNQWWIASRKENLTDSEIQRRAAAQGKK